MKKYNLFLLALSSAFLLIPVNGLAIEDTMSNDTSISSTQVTEQLTESKESSTTETTPTSSTEEIASQSSESQPEKLKEENIEANKNLSFSELSQYVNLNKKDQTILDKTGNNILGSTNDYLNQTLLAKSSAKHSNGKILYQLFNHSDKEIGYVFEDALTKVDGPEGSHYTLGAYATITDPNSSTLANFKGSKKFSQDKLINKTFFARGQYHHFNGQTYLSIFDAKGLWYGYVDQDQVTISSERQGSYVSFDKYITYSNKNYNTWSNFGWKYRLSGDKLVNKTLHARGIYYHYNGESYLSLYDQNGTWYGYVNQKATKLADGAQGIYHSYGKYVTFSNKNYDTWSSFQWNKRNSGQDLVNQTYLAKGIYHHANGNDYVSLYDNQNKWHGYVNQNAVKVADGKQGAYRAHNKYVSIKNPNYSTWQNFNWKKRDTTKNIHEKTLLAKGIYQHFNGDTYLSLFDSKGTWYGYLNQNATQETNRTGHAISINKYISVRSKNYDLWRNLNFTASKGTTKNMLNKPYLAKVKYQHFNGSTYYSLYDQKNNWQGYINQSGVTEAAGNNSTYVMLNAPYYNQMEKINGRIAYMGCEAASLLQALHLKGYAKNYSLHPFIDVMPRSKDNNPNNGFSGNPYGNTYGVYHSIFPKPLTEWANKYAKGNAANISGSSLTQLNKELTNGNPIILYVTINFEKADPLSKYHWGYGIDNAHVVTLDGYNSQTNTYHVSDPNAKGGYWVTKNKLQASYFANEKRAVVIK
ncbi:C39 family peptidase [Vagococcus carniphilus]|uniref:C39 family peptidase n=1 Tax=Vagococcus carniphilus TaxID=218144 RepID=UPI00289017D9|nr:C39 family peptidase [Vagococcus carniphilus]MDT2814682.1 C39 family peptidase [Vagococcus carniphilus]